MTVTLTNSVAEEYFGKCSLNELKLKLLGLKDTDIVVEKKAIVKFIHH